MYDLGLFLYFFCIHFIQFFLFTSTQNDYQELVYVLFFLFVCFLYINFKNLAINNEITLCGLKYSSSILFSPSSIEFEENK